MAGAFIWQISWMSADVGISRRLEGKFHRNCDLGQIQYSENPTGTVDHIILPISKIVPMNLLKALEQFE